MRQRFNGGGARQKAWTALQNQRWDHVLALSQEVGLSGTSLYEYIGALVSAGYVERSDDGELMLIRNTGPRAPSFSRATGVLHDWNLNPPMDGSAVRDAIAKTGLTHSAWLAKHGFHDRSTTHLRQMINGQRPVSPVIEAAARADADG